MFPLPCVIIGEFLATGEAPVIFFPSDTFVGESSPSTKLVVPGEAWRISALWCGRDGACVPSHSRLLVHPFPSESSSSNPLVVPDRVNYFIFLLVFLNLGVLFKISRTSEQTKQ